MLFKPQWVPDTVAPSTRNAAKPHSKFINFFSEVAIPGSEVSFKFPAIGRATELLKPPAKTSLSNDLDRPLSSKERERLTCFFYISLVLKGSQSSHFNLQWLNEFLERTEEMWRDCISTLRWLLTQSVGKGPGWLKDVQRTERLALIAGILKLSSYSTLEDRYLGILVQEPAEAGGLLSTVV